MTPITPEVSTFVFSETGHHIAGRSTGHSARVVQIDGEPWFVAADVCRAMGVYLNSKGQPNVTMALQQLKGEEVGFNPIEIKAKRIGLQRSFNLRL